MSMNVAVDRNVMEEDDQPVLSVRDYLTILKRRRWHFLLPLLAGLLLAATAMLLLPAEYESAATILIEEQEVPREFVTSTVTSFAAQRIQVIRQRVLTSESIREIAEKLDLFRDPGTGRRPPSVQLAERFREAMSLNLVSAEVIDPRSGRATRATIAFTLSFRHGNATTAQMVNNELVTRFLDENLRTRTERAASTEQFLGAEAAYLNDELVALESRIAEFKERHRTTLPELNEYNRSALDRASRELGDLELRLRELQSRDLELSSKMAQVSPYAPIVLETGQVVLSDYDRLKGMRAEYGRISALYSAEHPDVRSLKRSIAQLEQALAIEPGQPAAASLPPDNPPYLLLDTQRKVVRGEIDSLAARRRELETEVASLERVLAEAPSVERDYQALLRDYAASKSRYQDVRAKQRDAGLAENLEQERKGERFILLEPPSLPLLPVSPNRPMLALIGLLAGAVLGLLAVVVAEAVDGAIYGEKRLATLTGAPPLAVIGCIDGGGNEQAGSPGRRGLVYGAACAVLLLLVVVPLLVVPDEVQGLLQRLGW